ncbi:MAG: NAD-dependent epimerase/dehydratase family protein [Halanaeroarchaeum sp.]
MSEGETVLVTGGLGYVGSALLPLLQADDRVAEIRVLDSMATGSPQHLAEARIDDAFAFRQGDVRNPEDVRPMVEGADAVVHLAAITGTESTHGRREETMAVNRDGTATVLDAAVAAGVDSFAFASSCNVYGRAPRDESVDETGPVDALNPYAESKLAGESRLEAVSDRPVETTALRMSTNYGYAPGVRFNLVVNYFVFRALTGQPLTVYGDGTNWRPFIHVRDAARAFASAALEPDRWPASVYNVGRDDENYRIAEIADVVSDEVGPVDTTYLDDENPGPSYRVSFDRLSETGFDLEYTLREGVTELAAVLRSASPHEEVRG